MRITILFVFLAGFHEVSAQEDFLKTELNDATQYLQESYEYLKDIQHEMNDCVTVSDSEEKVKCLYHIESVLNSVLEALDNAFFDMRRAEEYAREHCDSWLGDIEMINENLSGSESRISITVDEIRSAESDLLQEDMNIILEQSQLSISRAVQEMKTAYELMETFVETEHQCP
jgi:hypothetical protein